MDKKAFEAAISAYADKIVDEDSKLVEYVISKSIKTEIYNREGELVAKTNHRKKQLSVRRKQKLETLAVKEQRKAGSVDKKPRKEREASYRLEITTPKGFFTTVKEAAAVHGTSTQALRASLHYHMHKQTPGWAYIKIAK